MGPMTRRERVMLAVFSIVLLLWLSGEWHGVVADDGRVSRRDAAAADARAGLAGHPRREGRVGRADLVRRPRDAGGAAGQGRIAAARSPTSAAGLVGGWPWWWALAALLVVYLYSHYAFASLVAHVTAMFPAFFAVGDRPRRAAAPGGAGVRVLLEPQRGDDALRHRPGADRVRRRLSDAGGVVARRFLDLAGAPGDLAADRLSLVEGDRTVVT